MSTVDIDDKWYFTGKTCKYGHIAPRLKKNRTCKECLYAKRVEYEHSEKYIEWKKKNKAKVDAEWQKRNKAYVNANTRKRQAAQLQRTPSWLTVKDYKSMEAKYAIAAWLSDVVGREYHVDHIIPLQGELVSGLHVPNNLSVIPAKDNMSKSNNFDTWSGY